MNVLSVAEFCCERFFVNILTVSVLSMNVLSVNILSWNRGKRRSQTNRHPFSDKTLHDIVFLGFNVPRTPMFLHVIMHEFSFVNISQAV